MSRFRRTGPGELTAAELVRWFNLRYEQLYGYSDPDAPVRILEARLQIVGVTPTPEPTPATPFDGPTGPQGSRLVHENGQEREAVVWRRDSLHPAETHAGPMIVEQYDTTIYVPAGFRVTVDERANLIGERADG